MKIEIWSDVACPFCYIGKRKFEKALTDFPNKDHVEVEFKSFQLDPHAPLYSGKDYYESLAQKFGNVEQAKQMTQNVAEQAKLVGLTFDFDAMKSTNTFDAHRLSKFAKNHGKDTLLIEKLFSAHFTEGKDVGDKATLTQIAEAVGLNKEEAMTVLEDKNAFSNDVTADIEEAKQFGISGVPYFIFNRKYAVSGAQPTETFSQALEKVWEKEKS